MRKWWIPVGGAATLLLAACPYHGKVPLGPPQPGLFDERLLGEWIADSTRDDGDHSRLWIARFDDDGYVVAGLGSCPAGGGRAHLTVLGDRTFLNVREEDEAGLYRIGRIEIDGNALRLTELSDSLDDVSTSDSLRARLLARWDDPVLYTGARSYHRTDRPVPLRGPDAMGMLPQACPYGGEVLLEEEAPASALDGFIGHWREDGGAEAMEFEVSRLANGHAQIAMASSPLDEGDNRLAVVYATRIGDALFVNGRGDDDGTMLGRLYIAGDTAEVRLINAGVRADSPAALRRFIEERLEDPSIYHWETIRWVRR